MTLAAAISLLLALLLYEVVTNNTSYASGWILLSMMLLLTLYGGRKKLTYPPLFTSSAWMQLHIYVGFLSVLVFFHHTGWRLPTGVFESTLYLLFMLLTGSGIVGLYLSRTLPRQMTARGGEVIYEQIPVLVRKLREQIQALVVESVALNGSTVLADFYRTRVADYLVARGYPHIYFLLNGRKSEGLRAELSALYRYLSEDEKAVAENVSDLLKLTGDLDFHYVRQSLLKVWLFLHIPLTYSTLLFSALHLILVYAFSLGYA